METTKTPTTAALHVSAASWFPEGYNNSKCAETEEAVLRNIVRQEEKAQKTCHHFDSSHSIRLIVSNLNRHHSSETLSTDISTLITRYTRCIPISVPLKYEFHSGSQSQQKNSKYFPFTIDIYPCRSVFETIEAITAVTKISGYFLAIKTGGTMFSCNGRCANKSNKLKMNPENLPFIWLSNKGKHIYRSYVSSSEKPPPIVVNVVPSMNYTICNREALQKIGTGSCVFCHRRDLTLDQLTWCDRGQTAVCLCGVDAVIANDPRYHITNQLLKVWSSMGFAV